MVAGAGHGTGDAGEDGLAIVLDAAGFAMHKLRGADDVASEGCADGLMAEADSEDWPLAGEALDERDEDAGVLRRTGAGREHEALGIEGLDLVDGELVVAADDHVGAEFTHVLHQVVGEGVVVVEDEDHKFKGKRDLFDSVALIGKKEFAYAFEVPPSVRDRHS